ncbi:hypothetical protein ACLOAV_004951 [Pseudogymnoascus australis]
MVHCKEVVVPLFTGEVRGLSVIGPLLCTRVTCVPHSNFNPIRKTVNSELAASAMLL